MPVTDADKKAQIYRCFGIPQGGAGFVAETVSSLWGPRGETYSFTAIITALDALLAATTSNQDTLIDAALTEWTAVTSWNPLKITTSSTGAQGRIVDYDKTRRAIVRELSNIIGFACPEGGFLTEARGDCGGMIVR